MKYDENKLIGKRIKTIEVDGYGITIETYDGYQLSYGASDGGYSCWNVSKRGDE